MMTTEVFAFKFFDMPVSVTRSAVISAIVLVVVLTIAAAWLTNLFPLDTVMVGIVGTVLHYFGALVHQYGHFFAAKRTGYPSTGLLIWSIVGSTLYPTNEPKLAPAIHIQRALGGPIASLLLSVIVALIAAMGLWSYSEFSRFILGWMLFDYFGLFTIGAFIPPVTFGSFSNDGSTILQVLRQKSPQDRPLQN